MKVRLGIIAILLLLAGLYVSAAEGFDDRGNPNDPTVNDRANACFEGGSMYGRCGVTDGNQDGIISQAEVDWDYRCGWYVIRYDEGLLSEEAFPDECSVLLPAPPVVINNTNVQSPPVNPNTRNASCTITVTNATATLQTYSWQVTWDSPYQNQAGYWFVGTVVGGAGAGGTLDGIQTSVAVNGSQTTQMGTLTLQFEIFDSNGGNLVESGSCTT